MAHVILNAGSGKVYTNGASYGTEIHLAPGDSADNWREVDTPQDAPDTYTPEELLEMLALLGVVL